jgi:hypothetical protein
MSFVIDIIQYQFHPYFLSGLVIPWDIEGPEWAMLFCDLIPLISIQGEQRRCFGVGNYPRRVIYGTYRSQATGGSD